MEYGAKDDVYVLTLLIYVSILGEWNEAQHIYYLKGLNKIPM